MGFLINKRPSSSSVTLFIAILVMKMSGSFSTTTIVVKLLTYDNNRWNHCDQSCSISFSICLSSNISAFSGERGQPNCFNNNTEAGPFPFNQGRITFTESEAIDYPANIPDITDWVDSNVSVSMFNEEQEPHHENGYFTWRLMIRTVPESHFLVIDGAYSSMTMDFSTFCTPPFYLEEEACTKFCQGRDNEHGHYTCTINGTKECKQGWYNPSSNCTRSQPEGCHCSNGATCDTDGRCICSMGFTGMDCSQDVNECIWEPGVCEHKDNTVCNNLYGFYTCECKPGYTGSKCQYTMTTGPPMTEGQSVSPSSSSSVDPSETPVSSKQKNLILPIGVAGGLLLLVILVVVLIVLVIRQRNRMTRATDAPGIAILAVQRESRRATSNEAHSNPYVMDESTFTKNNGVLPADSVHPIYDNYKGGAVLPPYRLNEIPGPRDSIYLEDNVIYETSGNVGSVEDMTAVYANVKK